MEKKRVSGGNLAGGNPKRGRVENDYYATPREATQKLLSRERFAGNVLEPACGEGHISKVLLAVNFDEIISFDIVDRGYGEVEDFFDWNIHMDNIITNPPFKYFTEFAKHSLEIANRKVCLFGKLQALEGYNRTKFLMNSPLRTVYVFRKRVNPMRNGKETDENGKKWSSTMAFAWYVWEKGFEGKPTIEWI